MKLRHRIIAAMVGAAIVAFAAPMDVGAQGTGKMPAGIMAHKLDNGTTALADSKMKTLYTFAKDADGKSACSGGCATNWPPMAAAADAKPMGEFTVITRDDGSKQWAYKGKPLYTWVKDTKPGEASGDGMGNGAWKIAVP